LTTAPHVSDLLSKALAGDQRSIGRLLSQVEASLSGASDVMDAIRELPRTGRAVGVIGPPGAGKSVLVASLVAALVAQGRSVAVLANDPTGAHSGGALLGDRVRMKSLSRDPRVFIRSVAARDPLRSLSETTFGAVALLTRLGFDYVLIEAVGAGQSDIGTSLVADTTMLVLVPGLGDDVQAMKSGVMEVADIVVVNKADLPDAKATAQTLRQAVRALYADSEWLPPVVQVSAKEGTDIGDVLDKLDEHRNASPAAVDAQPITDLLVDLVTFEVTRRLRRQLPTSELMADRVREIAGRDTDVIRSALALADQIMPER
jgi:LAO/AO transport system kinase